MPGGEGAGQGNIRYLISDVLRGGFRIVVATPFLPLYHFPGLSATNYAFVRHDGNRWPAISCRIVTIPEENP
jgi:hypothetical protein